MDRTSAAALTAPLAKLGVFQIEPNDHPSQKRMETEYIRAQAIARKYNLTAEDVHMLSDKFWAMHLDNITALSGAALALLTIQYNLVAGTLVPWAAQRPELRPILQRILDFDCSGQFMLTEQAHGLDAIHLETTATMLHDGGFDLHTPHDGAAKYMPPSVPLYCINMARIAIVIARLVVDGEDRGVRPFVVPLSNGKEMCEGVICRKLPERGGTGPLGHSLTWFNHVRMPASACLGSTLMPKSKKVAFQEASWRITVGSLCLGGLAVPAIGVSAYILATYSRRRTVVSSETGAIVPILSFRTQQIPIMHALTQSFIMHAFFQRGTSRPFAAFCDTKTDVRVRMGIATAAKCVMFLYSQESCTRLSDRAGAQGLFCYNQIIALQLEMRGVGIAEGDTLVISIRLATELILNRYDLPPPRYPESLPARHEISLLNEARAIYKTKLEGKHRSDAFNRLMLPRCEAIVHAIGMRFLHEAAIDAGLPRTVLDLYEVDVIKHDPAWYALNAGIDSWDLNEREDRAISAALPELDQWLAHTHGDSYALAPIMTAERWSNFVSSFPTFRGNASTKVIEDAPRPRL